MLTDETLIESRPDSSIDWRVVSASEAEEKPVSGEPEPLPPVVGSQLAYAISTSGTTGRPKLIGVEHSQASNLLAFATQNLLRPEDVRWVAFLDAPSFDSSISQIFVALSMAGHSFSSQMWPISANRLSLISSPVCKPLRPC